MQSLGEQDEKRKSAPEAASNSRILIVDDDDQYLRMMQRILSEHHDCAVAEGGRSARKALASKEFDLIVCDLEMPGERGLELLAYSARHHPDLAVMLVTAFHDPDAIEEVRSWSIPSSYLLKPFTPDEFSIAVENVLAVRQLMLAGARVDTRAPGDLV